MANRRIQISHLVEILHVSRPTFYKTLARARKKEFVPRNGTNDQYRRLKYGLKCLAKVERTLEEERKKKARRYNKSYPSELVYLDTKRLPLLQGEDRIRPREYLFVALDGFSRELFAGIFPDKTQHSSVLFLKQVADKCPYTIKYAYSDNGKEYKGTISHEFVNTCTSLGIGQKFIQISRPQTNGKAERVIQTLMEMLHGQELFKDRNQRQISLLRFVNFYDTDHTKASAI